MPTTDASSASVRSNALSFRLPRWLLYSWFYRNLANAVVEELQLGAQHLGHVVVVVTAVVTPRLILDVLLAQSTHDCVFIQHGGSTSERLVQTHDCGGCVAMLAGDVLG